MIYEACCVARYPQCELCVLRLRLLHVHVTCEIEIKPLLRIFLFHALPMCAFCWPDFLCVIKKCPYFCDERNRNS